MNTHTYVVARKLAGTWYPQGGSFASLDDAIESAGRLSESLNTGYVGYPYKVAVLTETGDVVTEDVREYRY